MKKEHVAVPEKLTQFIICSWLKRGGAASRSDIPAYQRLLQDCDEIAGGMVGGQELARDGRKLWKFILITCKGDEEVNVIAGAWCTSITRTTHAAIATATPW